MDPACHRRLQEPCTSLGFGCGTTASLKSLTDYYRPGLVDPGTSWRTTDYPAAGIKSTARNPMPSTTEPVCTAHLEASRCLLPDAGNHGESTRGGLNHWDRSGGEMARPARRAPTATAMVHLPGAMAASRHQLATDPACRHPHRRAGHPERPGHGLFITPSILQAQWRYKHDPRKDLQSQAATRTGVKKPRPARPVGMTTRRVPPEKNVRHRRPATIPVATDRRQAQPGLHDLQFGNQPLTSDCG